MRRRVAFASIVRASLSGIALAFLLGALELDRSWFELHLTQSFCALEPVQLRRLAIVRISLALTALLLAFVVRPWLGRRAADGSARDILRERWRWGLAALLAFPAADLILRHAQHASTLAPPALPPVQPDAFFGWGGAPSTTTILRADDRDIPYALDLNGYRAREQDEVIDPDQPTLLFGGESITEGVGVRFEESYPALVAADLDMQAALVAVHGYGDGQIHWAVERQLAVLRRPRAVVTFLIPQLLERDLDPSRPRLVLDARGSLVRVEAEPQPPAWWRQSPVRRIAHGLFPYHDASPIELARAIFRATATDARARGAYPLFVLTNWGPACLPPAPGEPTLAQRIFVGLDLPWIEVKLDPEWIEHSTFHPNAKAHRVMADAIERALTKAKVVAAK